MSFDPQIVTFSSSQRKEMRTNVEKNVVTIQLGRISGAMERLLTLPSLLAAGGVFF